MWLLIAGALVGFGVLLATSDAGPVRRYAFVDFYDYYFAAEAITDGADPYDVALADANAQAAGAPTIPGSDYIYPAWFAAVAAPLTALPPSTATLVWYALSAALLLVVVGWLMRSGVGVVGVLSVVTFAPVATTLFVGQTNLLLLALLVAAWHWRNARPLTAGAAIGVAAALKLAPLLLLIALWRPGRRRMIAAALATFVLALAIGELAAPGSTHDFFAEVLPHATALDARLAHPVNQGLPGLIARLTLPSPWNDLEIGLPDAASALALAFGLALAGGLAAWVLWPRRAGLEEWRTWSALLIATVVVSPLAWESSYAVLILPAALSMHLRGMRVALVATWVAFLAQRALDAFADDPASFPLLRAAPLLGAWALLAALALLATTIVMGRVRSRPAPSSPGC